VTNAQIDAAFGFSGMAGHWTSAASQPAVPTLEQVPTLLDVLGVALDEVPDRVRRLLWDLNGRKGQPGENWLKREVVGPTRPGAQQSATNAFGAWGDGITPTAPATPEAARWEGWGTALKPAHEPVVVARKPLSGTVAANVLEHGTGALNIDGCRISTDWDTDPNRRGWQGGNTAERTTAGVSFGVEGERVSQPHAGGRWPANVVLDPEAAEVLDRQSGETTTHRIESSCNVEQGKGWSRTLENRGPRGFSDSDGASRFFTVAGFTDDDLTSFRYVAKPDRAERNAGLDGNFHPTVKPLDLMRWLVRLVTPPGGTVLEPFAGSGTTLAAAVLEGFDAVGIELTADYLPLIEGRVRWAEAEARFGPVTGPTKVRKDAGAPTLFDEDGAA
jgi:site-specific DNA-methyltransferase (adenine-specific)